MVTIRLSPVILVALKPAACHSRAQLALRSPLVRPHHGAAGYATRLTKYNNRRRKTLKRQYILENKKLNVNRFFSMKLALCPETQAFCSSQTATQRPPILQTLPNYLNIPLFF